MRGAVPDLPTPHPLGLALPAMYQEDGFVQRFVAGLDDVLAPILLTLDCLEAYLDPALAPADFVDWLAGWVAVPPDEGQPLDLRRELVRRAADLHRWRGTARGLGAEVALLTGGEVRVTDSGGVTVSSTPESAPAVPVDGPTVHVTVRVPDPAAVDERRLRAAVVASVPAHVLPTIEIVAAPPPRRRTSPAAPTAPDGHTAPSAPPAEGEEP
ncbi:phage tail protein [Rhizomonospora bruguierae]|uniref:phage tail protein n=1 Tax=Rhizomonospora bruguierae TaxID=1581705 RepID=UPI0020BFAA32|nr:phage tail protein [Micromonospora sp. NBRC 107566]